jgi:hypothetical protein
VKKEDYQFFEKNGYLPLGKILDKNETETFVKVFDRDREKTGYHWYEFGHHQSINCDALATSPEFDDLLRHPKVMEPISELMGGKTCFSEICIRHMEPYEGELHRGWHRDRAHLLDHPLRMDYIQLMVYLADVDETTHCFSISPESIDQDVLDTEAQLEHGGIQDLYGESGTAILFNVSVLHTATTRKTNQERKSVQVYYGHQHQPYLSEDSIITTRLWRDHPDSDVRDFYSVFNRKTREYIQRVEDDSNLPLEEVLELLVEIDYETGKRQRPD